MIIMITITITVTVTVMMKITITPITQDGEYCDIIRDCSQKIQISGGRGYFQSPDQDPVVAICVGC